MEEIYANFSLGNLSFLSYEQANEKSTSTNE